MNRRLLRFPSALWILSIGFRMLRNHVNPFHNGTFTVGVMGDERTYSYIVALRAVTSVDGMTGEFFPIDYSILDKVARRIVNEVNGVNRVLYDVTGKPPATIEFE